MTELENHQLQLERMQRLDDALDRAEAGCADQADWNIIRFECGMPRKPIFTPSINHSGKTSWQS